MIQAIGTGYISSAIITKEIVKKNGEKVKACYFQIASYKYTDNETRKKIYDHFLCQCYGKYSEIITNNFVEGQKVYITGQINESNIQNKNDNSKKYNIISIIVNHIEFMANPKDQTYDKKDMQANLDDSVKEYINNADEVNTEETFV